MGEMKKISFWNGKKVLVTGHTSFKGSWLCKMLEIVGADVVGYGLQPSTHPNLHDVSDLDIHSINGDIRDFDSLLATFERVRPEVVIHMAAQPLVLDSYRLPRFTYEVNVMGALNVLECTRLNGGVKSLINVTTDKVYLNKERAEGYTENDELNGYDPYSNSKSCAELMTSSYNNSFLRDMSVAVSTMRSGNVIGGGDFSANRLIPDCARALARGEVIRIRNPNAVRPYLHVLDTLSVYIKVAEIQYRDISFAGAYNIGPAEDECATSAQLATYFCNTWGDGASWEHVTVENPHESNMLKLDCSKAKNILKWTPRWNIEKAVEETVLWYKAYFSGKAVKEVMVKQIGDFFIGEVWN